MSDDFINSVMNNGTDLKQILQQHLRQNDLFDSPLNMLQIDSPYVDIEDILNQTTPDTKFMYKALHINIHSIPDKLDKLKEILIKCDHIDLRFDFILLCETFLKDHSAHLYEIPGYKLVSKNRKVLSKGGVAIYIREQIPFKIREDLSVFHEGEFETIFIETTGANHAIVGEVYRIPNSPEVISVERFESLLAKLNALNQKTSIIIGTDQNFDYLKIDSHDRTADLFNNFISANLIPTITKPTRVTHSSATLIDNIYIRHISKSIMSGIIPYNISDHFPVFCFTGSAVPKKQAQEALKFKYRPICPIGMERIRNSLSDSNWNVLDDVDTESACIEFTNVVKSLLKSTCLKKK